MTTPIIEVRSLTKKFGSFKALDELELSVQAGEVAGFLGPNGAGKSTTIRILLGMLKADSGKVSVFGKDPWKDAVELHRRIAYVPGDVSLWPNLSGGEVIDLLGRLGGGFDPARKNSLIERFELDPTKKSRTYSKGNRQKVALVAAFAQQADLLIFDEPTTGLDPLMHEAFTSCVAEEKQDGKAVLLSSHVLAEVEKLCDTVTIIRSGRTVESGTLADIRHLTRSSVSATVTRAPSALSGLEGVHNLEIDGNEITFSVDNEHFDAVIQRLGALGVTRLVANPPSLDELFLRYYDSSEDSK